MNKNFIYLIVATLIILFASEYFPRATKFLLAMTVLILLANNSQKINAMITGEVSRA